MPDILDTIIERRREDLARLGPTLGQPIPPVRERPVVPFLTEKGAILEIKRASPSKGDIAPDLDVASLCRQYRSAGARAVSVLTEPHYFKGSLKDLLAASRSDTDRERPLAFLRKDFLLTEEEVEVSYRCGAGAVLLIARILETDRLMSMAGRAAELGLRALVEIRTREDGEKLRAVCQRYPVLAGVNARDLATFTIDPLVPAALIGSIPVHAVYESGIRNPETARYAARLGFQGILVGEEAARRPEAAAALVSAFQETQADRTGHFWRSLAERRDGVYKADGEATSANLELSAGGTVETASRSRPLVKICGITRLQDAEGAAELGADMLGFIFAESKRTARPELVREVRKMLNSKRRTASSVPLLVGVITELSSPLAKEAQRLCKEGILDAIQWHGDPLLESPVLHELPHYRVLRIGALEDIELAKRLINSGQVRILLDTKVEGFAGGTGAMIRSELLDAFLEAIPDLKTSGLWLAGGLGPDTVGPVVDRYGLELIDASSRLEAEPGIKDPAKLEAFFTELKGAASRVKQVENHIGVI
ncbi:bifunctional indole-3-glycerol phosphate synthase/phosphoribosylanthranilate isomerase [Gracilinema caldarium]|uniref:bifunctional indole-3-glycerol phosphate synthase/phosphoribosylanthranilate isomerase n=1 Tax=Gracilinema caldarium TaxID=215591 RepID=UPI0026F322C8|nr:bifunctional indole-3-glycerol phosphate synthase/phosphoribosylanthranilate isomerase [Gracilinema caldarium]